MSDVVVTVPKNRWHDWIAEGQLPGEPESGEEWAFSIGGHIPNVRHGERVYVVAHGKLRGYAPLVRIRVDEVGRIFLVRRGGAVAVTIPKMIQGFRGWQYRFWNREDEVPFPDWQLP